MTSRQKSPKQRANQDFNDAVKNILEWYANLTRLQEYFYRNVKSGHHLVYDQIYTVPDGQYHAEYVVHKKDVRGLYYQLRNKIKDLKLLFRRKKSRETVDLARLITDRPTDWVASLKGQNRPSVATSNLVKYIRSEDFGQVIPPQYDANGRLISEPSGGNLSDSIPLLRDGYGLKAAFALLFFHAIRVADVTGKRTGNGGGHLYDNDHRRNYFTKAMKNAFGTGISPYRYAAWGDTSGNPTAGAMEGLKIPNYYPGGFEIGNEKYGQLKMSTIDYLDNTKYKLHNDDRRITPDYAHLTVVQTILNLNIKDQDDLSQEEKDFWDHDDSIVSAINEYIYARDIRQDWVNGLKPKTDLRRKNMRKSPARKTPR